MRLPYRLNQARHMYPRGCEVVDSAARPFPFAPSPIQVPDDVLADLQQRLALTRWLETAGNDDRLAAIWGDHIGAKRLQCISPEDGGSWPLRVNQACRGWAFPKIARKVKQRFYACCIA